MAGDASMWDVVPLDDLTEEATPITYGVVKPGEEGDVLFVRGGDIAEGRVLISQLRTIGRDVSQQYRRTLLRGGEILVSLVGNPGQVAIAPAELAGSNIARQVGLVRLKAGLNAQFVSYFLQSHEGQAALGAQSIGSVQQVINLRDLKTVKIPLPPLAEQNAIAAVLGSLDDKIELNRRMNETLEAMARALFKSWFVDFDPVLAKAAGRDPGLPKPIADLFPDSFEDSELGEIPRGWEEASLYDFAMLNPESWTRETRPEVMEYVDLSNTKWGRIDAVTRYSQEEAPSRAQRVLRPLDTIVGTVRPGNGSYAFILVEGLTGSTGFTVLRPTKREYAEYVYLVASGPENIERLAHLADGAAYPAVRPEVVAATRVVKPDVKAIKGFADIATTILANIAANEAETSTLAILRDTLLPKLISGELRVADPARFLEGGD